MLGDDALLCLRDLKRWLKLYDEKANRLDVARCLAESNLVGGDLLQILAAWPENETDNKIKSKIALACVELLVPLTWPLEKTREMTVNHYRHTPYLQLAQLGYKRSIINFDGARILHTGVRVALPAMAQSASDRTQREKSIIKLVLYFIRNIAMITPPPGVVYEGDEAEISRSATIDAFDYQDILHLLLTLASSMGDEFNSEDLTVMEIIFHLVKGVNIEKLFMSEQQLDSHKADELANLRNQEAGLLRNYQRTAPTRHNRFGTMLWVQRDDNKMSVVSGQDALIDGSRSLAKMDSSKKFKPPRRAQKTERGPLDFDTPESLAVRANQNLRTFVGEFLDSGFNPLFQHIRKAIDREAERVLEYHPRQFFFLVSWFLEAERMRRKSKPKKKVQTPEDIDSFALVASVLNQEMFITLNRAMERYYEEKSWQDLNAAMRCFTQILLTVQEMSESPLEEDQDIAENILSRIFYEETTHDRVANIVRYYKDQGFGYLDACTELAHVYMRILENYSKQNTELQIRSKRRTRRKKKDAAAASIDDPPGNVADSEGEEDEAAAARTSNERKFDFKRFAARFLSQGCVDTFVKFCSYYNDLRPEQLKRAHRYFYRVAFKQEMSVMLFRVDIIHMLHKLIKGPDGLSPTAPYFKEWDELVRQLIKRCTRKMQERPELIVEMLFSKTNGTAHYLEYGYEKQTILTKPRPAAELEVKGGREWEEQVAIVVSALLDQNMGHHLEWVKLQLSNAETERRAWEASERIIASTNEDPVSLEERPRPPSLPLKPDTDLTRTALFKNGQLRLLLTLLSLSNLSDNEEPVTTWVIPSSLTSDQIKQSLDLIKAAEFSPPVFDDGMQAGDQIRRKSAGAGRRKAEFDDDSDGIDDDDVVLFEPGGPAARKPSEALAELKKQRRKRRNSNDDDEGRKLTDEQRAEREQVRREKELEKNRKIKSTLYVQDSDDDDDAERDRQFFEEEKARQKQRVLAMKDLLNGGKIKQMAGDELVGGTSKKRKMVGGFVDSDSETEDSPVSSKIRQVSDDDDEDDESDEAIATPTSSSPRPRTSQTKRQRLSSNDSDDDDNGDEIATPPTSTDLVKDTSTVDEAEVAGEEDEDDLPASRPIRRRQIGAFVDDDSDDD